MVTNEEILNDFARSKWATSWNVYAKKAGIKKIAQNYIKELMQKAREDGERIKDKRIKELESTSKEIAEGLHDILIHGAVNHEGDMLLLCPLKCQKWINALKEAEKDDNK